MRDAADYMIGLLAIVFGIILVGAGVIGIGFVFVLLAQWIGLNTIFCVAAVSWMLYHYRNDLVELGRSIRDR